MNKGISIIVPSRGRPFHLFQMINSAMLHAKYPADLEFCIGLDADDKEMENYAAQSKLLKQYININIHIAYVRTPSPMHTNILCKQYATKNLFLFVGDDVIFRQPSWDLFVYNLWMDYPDNILVGYFNDGRDRNKCEHFVLHRDWLNQTNNEICPFDLFQHFCLDMWIEEIAKRLDRIFWFNYITLEHLNPKYGKMAKDETYQYVRREINYAGTRMSIAERDTYIYHLPEQVKLREEQFLKLKTYIDEYYPRQP